MKKCNDCNVDMIENCVIGGQHPFEIGVDGRTDITIHIPTGTQTDIFGIKVDNVNKKPLKARICPKCGKIELYADIK